MEKIKKLIKLVLILLITYVILRIIKLDFKTALEMILTILGVVGGVFAYILILAFICLKKGEKNPKKEPEEQSKKSPNRKKIYLEKLKPEKIKDNLVIIDEKSDNYLYRPTYRLTCCHQYKFKVSIHGDIEKSIFGGVTFRVKEDGFSFNCECLECHKQYEVFNSTKDGYDGYVCTEKEKDFSLEEFSCTKCHENDFDIEITYDYDAEKESVEEIQEALHNINKDDITNTFGWITITIKCNKCGRDYQRIVDYECM